jgi:DNA-binding transcriptional regulator YhcF (GntR family)
MAVLSVEVIFLSSVHILLFEDKAISLTFSPDGISIKLPPSRRLAEHLSVTHEYILPLFSMIEEEGLITRVERVGIFTTRKGTERFGSLMRDRYPSESEAILGETILRKISGDTASPLFNQIIE